MTTNIARVNAIASGLGYLPFFFGEDLAKWSTGARNQVLLGGRGTGKTAFIKVAAKLTPENKYISGRDDWELAVETLREYATAGIGRLFIDDLDRLVARGRSTEGHGLEFQRLLERAVQKARSNGCLVTSTLPLDEVIYPSDPSSLFFQGLPEMTLRWWEKEWVGLLKNQLVSSEDDEATSLQIELGGRELCIAVDDLFSWVNLTGGHPTQVAAGIREVLPLLESARPCTRRSAGAAGEFLHHMEAVLLQKAIRPVRKLLNGLEGGELTYIGIHHDVQHRAWKALRELADLPPGRGAPLSHKIASALYRIGLVYPVSEVYPETWDIPGTIVRKEIAPERRTPAITAAPSRDAPESQGTILVETGRESVRVPLSGAPWRIVQMLVSRMPETVPVPTLMETCGFSTELALRSGLKRLRDDLGEYGVETLIKNDWGAGYRILPPKTGPE